MTLEQRIDKLEKELAEIKNCFSIQPKNINFTHEFTQGRLALKSILDESIEEQLKSHLSRIYL